MGNPTGPSGRIILPCAFVIATSTTLSAIIDIYPGSLVAVGFPNIWDAANVTFRVGTSDDDLKNLYDGAGNEFALTGGTSRWVPIENPNLFVGFRKIQLRSGTSVATVTQNADTSFSLIGQRLYTG